MPKLDRSLTKRFKMIVLGALLFATFASMAQAQGFAPRAYVSNEHDGTISVINTTTDKVISTIRVGGRLRGIHLSQNGRTVYVAMTDPANLRGSELERIVAVDAATGRVMARYPAGSDPEQFAIN